MTASTSLTDIGNAMFDLSGKTAVVTGASRGLGKEIAKGLAAFGAKIMLCGRQEGPLRETAEELAAMGAETGWLSTDVAKEDQVQALRDATLKRFGAIDILVNNAGMNPWFQPLERTDLAQWQTILDVNLTGVFLCCRWLGVEMFGRGGSIINVSSIAGHVGLARSEAYCAAKGGLELFSKSLAVTWGAKNIRVNCLAPGYFETELTQAMWTNEKVLQAYSAKTIMGRFGRLNEIAGGAVFLASPAAAYMTGQSLVIDGGWTAQ